MVDLNNQAFQNGESFIVPAGTSGTTSVNTVVSGGFDQPITLSAVNLPAGITATFSPDTLTGFGTSQVTFTVALNVKPGDYTITVAGTSGGVTESTTASLTVGPAPPPNFSLNSSASSLTVDSGGQGMVNITVTPEYGFSSAVSFACLAPLGTSCTFTPATVTPSGSAVTTQLVVAVSKETSALHRDSPSTFPFATAAATLFLFGWRGRRRVFPLVLLVALASVGFLSGCGGASSHKGGGGSTPVTTTVTITATSTVAMQTTTISLTVN